MGSKFIDQGELKSERRDLSKYGINVAGLEGDGYTLEVSEHARQIRGPLSPEKLPSSITVILKKDGKAQDGIYGEPAFREFDVETGQLRMQTHFNNGQRTNGPNDTPATKYFDGAGKVQFAEKIDPVTRETIHLGQADIQRLNGEAPAQSAKSAPPPKMR